VDQNLNNSPNDFLWSLLENPANDANSHVYNLHRLVNDFPQSGILQALLAHASEEKNLKRASAYFNPRALFKLINAPSTFTGVPGDRIVIQPGISVNGGYRQTESPVYGDDHSAYTTEDLEVDQNAPKIYADEEHPSHHAIDELVVDHNAEAYLGHAVEEEQHTEQPGAGETGIHDAEQHIENEPEVVHQPAQDELEAPVIEHVTEELTGEPEVYNPVAYAEPEAAEHFTHHEAVVHENEERHHIEDVLPVSDEATVVVESHSEIPGDHTHQEDIAEHVGDEPVQEVHEEKAEHPVEEFSQAPEQSIELETEKDEPEPVIELPEEQHEAPLAEIPVAEEPEPEMPVQQEHKSESEIPVQEEPEPEMTVQEEPEPEMTVQEERKPDQEIAVQGEPQPEPEIAAEEISTHEAALPVSEEEDEVYDEIVSIEDINLDWQRGGQFISFDQEFGAHENGDEKLNAPAMSEASAAAEAEQQDVSKYHDEKMPYTFMWWLDKTRKEHAQAYQPYIKPAATPSKKEKKITDELQQQYFENIFHITSVEELDKATPPPPAAPDFKRKEQVIIERFIKEEPQIKPQSSDKLDNENKAKKSSEDRDELVSETLAGIYSDQMLYHKAIASYKKLMLKFPEKSRYFAEKIEQLEKKTN
jgi:hypothetical protein